MSKPIFIIRFPYIRDLRREHFVGQRYYRQIEEQLHDYHVLSVIDNSVEKVEFECFNAPHTEIEFNSLKQMVMETLSKSLNQPPESE